MDYSINQCVSWRPAITHPGHPEGKDQCLTIGSITKVSRRLPGYVQDENFPAHPSPVKHLLSGPGQIKGLMCDLPSGLIPRR